MDIKELINEALDARKKAYSPYSKYKVGAALLCRNGKVCKGCNIENASYGATNCAERTAVFKAVSEGDTDFEAIVIAGGPEGDDPENLSDYASPCGICRQVLSEFSADGELMVILARSVQDHKTFKLKELLPESFNNSVL
ncbi:MAG: cytidine deaminase [Lachnospiraceae bacterium]|nr:cytidine deaminase [Lachnospiraceae bacterium]